MYLRRTVVGASILLMASTFCDAQCLRRSANSQRGRISRLSSTLPSPAGSLRSFSGFSQNLPAYGQPSVTGFQVYQWRLYQQQRLATQARQQRLQSLYENQNEAQPIDEETGDREPEKLLNARQIRSREENANKAFRLADRAKASGRSTRADYYYRKVIRLVPNSELATRASSAIAGRTP